MGEGGKPVFLGRVSEQFCSALEDASLCPSIYREPQNMRKEVRKMLDLIDEFALLNDQNSADLMALLTCLRSNDTDVYDEFKHQTVMSLRAIMFPRCYAHFKYSYSAVKVGAERFLGMDNPISLDPE